ncbi:T9SS type A sorting domain-containing protein [Chitinophaga oryziterrae]|uniref:T9SS type A sorting domain-containing protein n=1 Tax=Chitinophaga oryziterrae TaxID=1031224 RepID=A0A6N8JI49_9BACT|nr:T9SS type A sorting domain-containing protein [Chitinophaga oryziterrae]MVT43948.1 T9SS type A sorting domain-containing protein [Chitinophaga oryziterrae]
MKKFLLFVSFVLFVNGVLGQTTPLWSSTFVYGNVQNPSGLGSLELYQNNTFSSAPFGSADGVGIVIGTGTTYGPAFNMYRNGSSFSYLFAYEIYPIAGRTVERDVPFYGPYKSYSGFTARWTYEMIAPNALTINASSATQICGNERMGLTSPLNWLLFSDSYVTTSLVWEYNLNGSATWKGMDSSQNNFFFYFTPASYIPELKSATQNVKFRCRIKAKYSDATYYSPYSAATNPLAISPPPPTVTDESKIVKTPSCFGQNNGKIDIDPSNIVAGYSTMRWILRPASTSVPCNPDLGNSASNCGDFVDESNGAEPVSSGVHATGVPKGDYALWLINPGSGSGNCFTSIPVSVGELADLSIANNTAQTKDVSCYGATDGVIGVSAAGGDASSGYYFKLTTSTGTVVSAEQLSANGTVLWQNLPVGQYIAIVRDNTCTGITRQVTITVSGPPQITGSVTVSQPLCINPGDGSIGIAASGGTNYKYNLYKNNVLFAQSATTTATSYSFNGLGGGAYTAEVINADYSSCPGWGSAVTLNTITALSLQPVSADSVSCNGGSDGALKVSASGGSGAYKYTLGAVTNTTGIFSGLSAGDYTVTLKNQATTCNDVATRLITVYQRAALQVSLQKTDITCSSAANGILKAVVTGGSGSYNYTWQQYKAGSWVGNSFWFNTDTQIEGLEPGTYRVIISDNKSTGCTVTSSTITLNDPLPVAFTNVTVNEAVCLTEGASVNLTASGGDGNYTYSWSTGAAFTNFTAGNVLHTAGTYTFRVSDGKGCKIETDTYPVTLPAAELSFSTQLSDYHGFNVSCTGNGDGNITVTATGGSTVYQYKLDNNSYQDSPVFNNLAAGSYTISVKDSRGCEKSTTVALIQPVIVIRGVKTDIKCYGAATGKIVTNISGGAAPYVCKVNGVSFKDSVTDLVAGNYTLSITDANGCSKDSLINIVNLYPALKVQSAVVTDISCYGTTGRITLATTGGDGVYNYTLDGAVYTSGAALTAGDYHALVTDGQGCTDAYPDQLFVTAPASALSYTAVLSDYNGYNISCSGGDNGFAIITATGGNGSTYSGYKYALDNGTFEDAALIEHINAGSHLLKVKDARGCISSASYTFTQSSLALDLALVSKQDVICAATPAGNITVKGSGGTGSLEYSMDNVKWQTATSFYNLIAGDYNIYVKDANSCGQQLSVQINSQDPAITIDKITLNDIVCYGSTGTINIQVHGGAGTLTNEYSLNGVDYTAFTNTTALGAGTYTVRVKDVPGCYSAVADAGSITAPVSALTAGITTSDFNGAQISCYGLSDGTFDITATGGSGVYQYSFNNGPYTSINKYDHLAAGTYPVKIQDTRGCVITKSVALQQAAAVSLTVAGIQDLSCGADPTGKITLQAAGGITPYQYELNTEQWQEMPVFPSLTSGSYTMQVKDKNGCMAAKNVLVKALNPAITATASITPVNCYGENSGAVKVIVSGGDGNYNNQWNVADPLHVPAGNYTLKVTDGKGCTQSFNYEVTQPDLLTLATIAPAVCDGLSDGRITANAQGGISPYQYAIDKGTWGITPVFETLVAGNYTISVQDVNGCNVSKDVLIDKLNVKPDVNFLVASRENALDTLVIKDISLPAPDNISWTYSPEAVFMGYDGIAPLIKFNKEGNYWIEMTATFGSCTYSLKKDIVINTYDPLAGPVYTLPVHVIDTVLLSPNPNNGYFSFEVKMVKKQQVVVSVYDMNGRLVDSKQYSPALQIDDKFALSNTVSGTYLLRVIAENDSKDVRFIISK